VKKILIILMLAGAASGGAYYWQRDHKDPSAAGPKTSTAKVERGRISMEVATTGRIVANLDVDIKCKASGQVIYLPYDVSDPVTSGTVIIELDPVDELRVVKQAEVGLTASKAKLVQAKQSLQVAERTLKTEQERAQSALKSAEAREADARAKADRMQALLEKKLASQEEYETVKTVAVSAVTDLETAKVKIEELKTQEMALELKRQDVKLAETEVDSDEIQLSIQNQRLKDTRVFAPLDGVLAARTVQIGQIIASGVSNVGGGTTILTISDLSHIFVLASVDESDIGKVQVGQPAMITADAFPSVTFMGKVVRIATRGVNTTNVVTFEVKIEVTSENKQMLKPEMTTNIEIVAARKEDVPLIPADAISRRMGKETVLVMKDDGTSEPRPVQIGINDGFRAEVLSGLEEGETVVIRKSDMESRWRGGMRGGPPAGGRIMMMGGGPKGGGGRR